MKLLMFQWFETRNINASRNYFLPLSSLEVFFSVYIIYERFHIFLMIKYKLHQELRKNDTEEECFQEKIPASDKTKYFYLKAKKNCENCQCLGCSLLQRVYSSKMSFVLTYRENWYFKNKRTLMTDDHGSTFFPLSSPHCTA